MLLKGHKRIRRYTCLEDSVYAQARCQTCWRWDWSSRPSANPLTLKPQQCAGTLLNMLALALLGCSSTRDFNGLPYGAVLLGLAGITFHLSQLHVSNLFPRSRGLISSLLVAGFTGCGILFYFLDLMFVAAGSTRCGP